MVAGSLLTASQANAQTPFSTITSSVWLDAGGTPNGIMDASETRIAGVLVNLMNATGDTVVSSTISNINGQYTLANYRGPGTYFITFNYPEAGYDVTSLRAGGNDLLNNAVTDAGTGVMSTASFTVTTQGSNLSTYNLGLVAKPDTRTFFAYNSTQNTQWTATLKVPKTNNTAAEVTGISLFVTDAVYHSSIGIENTSTTSASTNTSVILGGKVAVQLPNGNLTNLVAQTEITKAANFPIYDGVTDFGGSSGASWTNEFASAFDDYNYPGASEAHFLTTGTDSVSFPVTASALTTTSGSGNVNTSVSTDVAAGVFVVYTYVPGIVLPVEFISFEATKDGEMAKLQWSVAQEENNIGFDVERSSDGKAFTSIGFVATKAENGNSSEKIDYAFADQSPLAGTNIYRLKQIDRDGRTGYSNMRQLYFGSNARVAIFPNPASDYIIVSSENMERVVIYNINGQKINVPTIQDGTNVTLNVSNIARGIYNVQIISKDGTQTSYRISVK